MKKFLLLWLCAFVVRMYYLPHFFTPDHGKKRKCMRLTMKSSFVRITSGTNCGWLFLGIKCVECRYLNKASTFSHLRLEFMWSMMHWIPVNLQSAQKQELVGNICTEARFFHNCIDAHQCELLAIICVASVR